MPELDGPQFQQQMEDLQSKGGGQCFPYCEKRATDWMLDVSGDREDIQIFHGRYTQPATNDPGKMNRPHGWVVQGGIVQDWQTMESPLRVGKFAGVGWPEEIFNEVFSPEVDYAFTPQELNKVIQGTKTSGPFTPEEVQKYLGR